MILVHINCKTVEQADAVVTFLLDEKLMLNALVSEKMMYKTSLQGNIKADSRVLVMGTTKALLFTPINQKIISHFPKETPLVYAMPIVYMDEEQGRFLRENTEKV
ncbi:MAG: divalent cation tolerance protein CutA [Bacteroidota bacterium]